MFVRVPCHSLRLLLLCCSAVASVASGIATSKSLNSTTAMPVQTVTTILQDMKTKSIQLKSDADSHIADVRKTCTATKTESTEYIDAAGIQIGSLTAFVQTTQAQVNNLINEIASHEKEIADNEVRLKNLLTAREEEHAKYQKDIQEYDVTIAAIKRAQEILKVQGGSSSSFLQIRRSRIGKSTSSTEAIRQALHFAMVNQTNFSKDASQIFSDFDSLTTATKQYEANTGSLQDVIQNLLTTVQDQKTQIVNDEATNKGNFEADELALRNSLKIDTDALVTKRETRSVKELDLLRKQEDLKQYTETKAATETYLTKVEAKCAQTEAAYQEMNTLRTQEIAALEKAIAFIESLKSGALFVQLGVDVPRDAAPLTFPALGTDCSTDSPSKKLAGFIRIRAAQLSSSSLRKFSKKLAAFAAGKRADPLAEVKQMIKDLVAKLQQDSIQDAQKNEWCTQQLNSNEAARTSAKESIEKTTARLDKTVTDLQVVQQELNALNTSLDETVNQRAQIVQERATEKAENEQAIKDANESKTAVQAAMTLLQEYYSNVSKTYGAFYQRKAHQGLYATHAAPNITAPNITEMPADLMKKAPENVSLEAGNSVIAMLEVVRDRYDGIATRLTKQEKEADELHTETLKDLDAQIAAMEADYTGKKSLEADYTQANISHVADLQTFTTALDDANTNHENLKGPCLAGDDSAQRKLQLEGEINALKEAEQMILDFIAGGTFLQTLSRLTSSSEAGNVATVKDIAQVIQLLETIKTEVTADMASDQATYDSMKSWCTTNINILSTSINQHNTRDTDLVNMIEVSAQNKARLEIELKNLQTELSQAQQALATHAQFRTKDLEAYRLNEKELRQSIQSLDNAIVVLSGHYDKVKKEDERNFTAERAEAAAAKSSLNLTLVNVAGQVSKALKSMPASEVNAAMVSPSTNAILQEFFANPLELLGHKRATLTQTSALLTGSVDGDTVMGILKQLLETFQADLAAAQSSETTDAASFQSQQVAKQAEIDTLISSNGIKQEQLAHYASVNAQANADLAYLREIRSSDVAYLQQLQTQCALNDAEYQKRTSIRQEELKSINEAIAMLQANSNSGSGNFLLHSRVQQVPLSGNPQRSVDYQHIMFVHHRQPKNRNLLKVSKGRAATNASKSTKRVVQVEGVHHPRAALRQSKASSAVNQPQSLRQRLLPSSSATSLPMHPGTAREALRDLKRHAMVLSQRSKGVADDAFKIVIAQLETVHTDLKAKKQLESTMRDTCIDEKESSTREKETREGEQYVLENEKARLEAKLNETQIKISDLKTQIDEKNTSLVNALAARNAEHAIFNTSIAKELVKQTQLQQAVQVLRDFYASKGIVKLIQTAPQLAVSSHADVQVSAARQEQKRPTSIRAPTTMPVQLVSVNTARNAQKFGNTSDPTAALENVTNYTKLNKSSIKAAERLEIPNATQFGKPLRPHEGSKGVIGILEILISESENLVQQIVKDEEYSVDAYLLDVQKTNNAIDDLKQQVVSQNSVLADTQSDHEDNKNAITAVLNEIAAIIDYIKAVNNKCDILLANFKTNQAARQAEIEDIWEARNALLTQISDV